MEDAVQRESTHRRSPAFRLFRCRAGCYHLVWRDNLVIHLTPSQLREFLECAESLLRGGPKDQGCPGWFDGYRGSDGMYNLLLFQDAVVLRLREAEVTPLREASAAACQTLDGPQGVQAGGRYVM